MKYRWQNWQMMIDLHYRRRRKVDRWIDGQLDRQKDGQMDRWIEKKIDIEMDRQVDSSWRVFEQIQSYIPLGIYIQINMYLWGFNLDIRMGPHRDYEYIDKLNEIISQVYYIVKSAWGHIIMARLFNRLVLPQQRRQRLLDYVENLLLVAKFQPGKFISLGNMKNQDDLGSPAVVFGC